MTLTQLLAELRAERLGLTSAEMDAATDQVIRFTVAALADGDYVPRNVTAPAEEAAPPVDPDAPTALDAFLRLKGRT